MRVIGNPQASGATLCGNVTVSCAGTGECRDDDGAAEKSDTGVCDLTRGVAAYCWGDDPDKFG